MHITHLVYLFLGAKLASSAFIPREQQTPPPAPHKRHHEMTDSRDYGNQSDWKLDHHHNKTIWDHHRNKTEWIAHHNKTEWMEHLNLTELIEHHN